jgi:hypothetical protein
VKSKRPRKDIAEIFGHDPLDTSGRADALWKSCQCPFTHEPCSKTNHDKSVTYGTCALSIEGHPIIVCPKRFYSGNLSVLRDIAVAHFGNLPVYTKQQYAKARPVAAGVVLLGNGSGGEVSAGSMSLDWVIALVAHDKLQDYVVVEVQSIDITGNYRDNWSSYHRFRTHRAPSGVVEGEFGFNWANVHKRIIPQVLRKSLLVQQTRSPSRGLELLLPDRVFEKFDEIMDFGSLPPPTAAGPDVIRVRSYSLDTSLPKPGVSRSITEVKSTACRFDDFARRFISSTGPGGKASLDDAIRAALD